MLEVGNTTQTALSAGQTIPFTTVYFNTNNKTAFNSSKNSLVISKSGYYKVGGSFVFTSTNAGNTTITMYVNGVAEPTALATFTATAGGTQTFVIPSKYIQVIPSTSGVVEITFVVSTAGTLQSANAFIYYIPRITE